jgi:hypothetical protein
MLKAVSNPVRVAIRLGPLIKASLMTTLRAARSRIHYNEDERSVSNGAERVDACFGIAIDSTIHLMFGVRRLQRDRKKGWDAWVFAHEEQWRGIGIRK